MCLINKNWYEHHNFLLQSLLNTNKEAFPGKTIHLLIFHFYKPAVKLNSQQAPSFNL